MSISSINLTPEQLTTAEGVKTLNEMIDNLSKLMPGDGEQVRILSGFETPESNIVAEPGSLYMRKDGGAGTSVYIKVGGTGATSWVGINTAGVISGATAALDNLSLVAINTSLISDTDNTDDLGTTDGPIRWRHGYFSGNLSDGTNALTVANAKTAYDHVSNDGSDHSFIDQNVKIASTPQFAGLTTTDNIAVDASGTLDIGTAALRLQTVYTETVEADNVGVLTPTAGNYAANKDYVDSVAQGLSWQESVLNLLGSPAVGPDTGDRYIATATASGWTDNNIYEYNGVDWDETVAVEGYAAWVENINELRVLNDTDWVQFGGATSHNSTVGKQGGTTDEYYHLTNSEYAYLGDHVYLINKAWSAAGHTIDDDIVPTASGTQNIGTRAIAFSEVNAGTVYADDVVGTSITDGIATLTGGDFSGIGTITATILTDGSVTITGGDIALPDGGTIGSTSYGWLFDETNGDVSTTASVGIGITTPGSALEVNGDITADEDIVPDASGAGHIGTLEAAFASGHINELFLEANPTDPLQAAPKQYVDAAMAVAAPGGADTQVQYNNGGLMGGAAGLTYDDVTGDVSVTNEILPTASGAQNLGTMSLAFASGYIDNLFLNADPTTPLQAATKQYVDNQGSALTTLQAVGTSDITCGSAAYKDMTDMVLSLTGAGTYIFTFDAPIEAPNGGFSLVYITLDIDGVEVVARKYFGYSIGGENPVGREGTHIHWIATLTTESTAKIRWKDSGGTATQHGTDSTRVFTFIKIA